VEDKKTLEDLRNFSRGAELLDYLHELILLVTRSKKQKARMSSHQRVASGKHNHKLA
jgi:hypothetical protein